MTRKKKAGPQVFWGIDTEYFAAGKHDPSDVHSIQTYNGKVGLIFWSPEEFREWLQRTKPKLMFTWTIAPEFGSLRAWGFLNIEKKAGRGKYSRIPHPWKKTKFWEPFSEKPIAHFYIPYQHKYKYKGEWKTKKKRVMVFDVRVFFHQMRYKGKGMGSLEMAGEFLSDFYGRDLHKLPKPFEGFGERPPRTKEERERFEEYAVRDAEITYWAGVWFQENIIDKYIPGTSFKDLYSWGTAAAKYFNYPEVNKGHWQKGGAKIFLDPLDDMIRQEATFAGRSEAFWTGYLGDIYYCDISSLYPVETVVTEAIRIRHVKPLSPIELKQIRNPEDLHPYGWLRGTFYTENDLWGLPYRNEILAEHLYYVTGTVSGLFHTFDLEAARAEILNLEAGYVPIFMNDPEMDRYYKLTMKKLDKQYQSEAEKYAIKGILNSATGKFGAYHPISIYSNFPVYSTIVASSHRRLSWLFDKAPKPVYYCDTDSVFTREPITGKLAELESWTGEYSVPLLVDIKGTSEEPGTMIFRRKMYYQAPNYTAYGGWKPYVEFFKKICQTLPEQISVLRQVTKKWATRNKAVIHLEIGRFVEISETYNLAKLEDLFKADDGRIRPTRNTYQLCRE